MPSSNQNEYTWTVQDVRDLDKRLSTLDSKLDNIQAELSNRSHVIVDNSDNSKDKIAVYVAVAISVVFTFIYVANQLGLFK